MQFDNGDSYELANRIKDALDVAKPEWADEQNYITSMVIVEDWVKWLNRNAH